MNEVRTPGSLLQVEQPLRSLVLRMLSVRPEARGSVAQLAEELEQAASSGTKKPLPENSSQEDASTQRPTPAEPPLSWWPRLALTASALTPALAGVWFASALRTKIAPAAQVAPAQADEADGGTSGLGEATATTTEPPEPSLQQAMAEEALPEPFDDQQRPDTKSHATGRGQSASGSREG